MPTSSSQGRRRTDMSASPTNGQGESFHTYKATQPADDGRRTGVPGTGTCARFREHLIGARMMSVIPPQADDDGKVRPKTEVSVSSGTGEGWPGDSPPPYLRANWRLYESDDLGGALGTVSGRCRVWPDFGEDMLELFFAASAARGRGQRVRYLGDANPGAGAVERLRLLRVPSAIVISADPVLLA